MFLTKWPRTNDEAALRWRSINRCICFLANYRARLSFTRLRRHMGSHTSLLAWECGYAKFLGSSRLVWCWTHTCFDSTRFFLKKIVHVAHLISQNLFKVSVEHTDFLVGQDIYIYSITMLWNLALILHSLLEIIILLTLNIFFYSRLPLRRTDLQTF